MISQLIIFQNPKAGKISDFGAELKDMAKRPTGVGKRKKSHSHKTKKRLEIKRLMLKALAKKRKHG